MDQWAVKKNQFSLIDIALSAQSVVEMLVSSASEKPLEDE